jgi:hypothetical protein
MPNSKKPKKKFNPKGKAFQLAERQLKAALRGITVAYNSTWGEKADFCGENYERLVRLVKGNKVMAHDVSCLMPALWRAYVTINCETQDGEGYAYALPVIEREINLKNLTVEIETVIVPAALAKRNVAHVKDWGYLAEIVR